MSKKDTTDLDFVITYYQHQYERIDTHENNCLTVSNLVVGITVLAFTFGFSDTSQVTLISGVALPAVVIIANILAILSFEWSAYIRRYHRDRAKRVLETYASQLYEIDQDISWKRGVMYLWSTRRTQSYVHFFLAIVALVPFFIYLGIFSL